MRQEEATGRWASESALAALGLPADEGRGASSRAWSGEVMVNGRPRVFQLMARREENHLEAHVSSFDPSAPQEKKAEADLTWERSDSGVEASSFSVDGHKASAEEALARIAACAAFAHKVRDRK